MATIFLVRHGDSQAVEYLPGRSPGVHLSSRGRDQTAQLAEKIKNIKIDAVYCSPLERTRETAEILAAAFGLEPILDDQLIEIATGDFTGKSFSELEHNEEWQMFHAHKSLFPIPGGELFLEAQNRMVTEIERLRRKYPSGNILIVSHGDPIKSVITYYLGIPIDFSGRLIITTAALTALKIEDSGAALVCFNYISSPERMF